MTQWDYRQGHLALLKRRLLAFNIILLAVVASTLTVGALAFHQQLVGDARVQVTNMARSARVYAEHQFEEIQAFLDLVAAEVTERESLGSLSRAHSNISGLGVRLRSGIVLTVGSVDEVDMSRSLTTAVDNGLDLASKPRYREGAWEILVSRHGADDVDVRAWIKIGGLEEYHRVLQLGPNGSAGMMTATGTVVARFPAAPGVVGQDLGSQTVAFLGGGMSAVGESRSPIDRVPRLLAMERTAGAPFIAYAALGLDDILAKWRIAVAILAAFGLAVIVVSALLSQRLFRAFSKEVASGRALDASEDLLKKVLEAFSDVIWTRQSPDGAFQIVAGEPRALIGVGADELSRDSSAFRRHIHRDDAIAVARAWTEFDWRFPWSVEYRVELDGKTHWVAERAKAVWSADGSIERIDGVLSDITGITAARSEVRRRDEFLGVVIDSAADAIIVVDADLNVVLFNRGAEATLGINRNEAIGRSATSILPAQARSLLDSSGEIRHGARPMRTVVVTTRPDGTEFPFELTVNAWRDETGRKSFSIIIGRDLSEETARRQQVERSQRMELVGQLTGGIAHDFNNLLTIISLNLEMLGDRIGHGADFKDFVLPAMRAAHRGSSLTNHLLAFARRQPLKPEATDPVVLIRGLAQMIQRTFGERYAIQAYMEPQTWPCFVDPAQLESALLNLLVNARDAMPAGGRIVLETHNVTLEGSYTDRFDELEPGDYVRVSVADEGEGMTPEVMARAFEPFFTTKPAGKGSGLGLSMVFGFAKQSKGHLNLYSEPGQGTTIKLYLPRAGNLAAVPVEPTKVVRSLPLVRVLVVEDDEELLATASRMLRGLGMTVIEASNAAAALDLVNNGAEFTLLFTDVVLAGSMNGKQLAEKVLQLRPGTRVIFTSGYTENAIVHHGRLDEGVLLLSKPYDRDALQDMLAEALT